MFCLTKNNLYALPILHYTMEFAEYVRKLILHLQPDCIAVELPETQSHLFLRGAARLPDISVIKTDQEYFLIEPADALSEALRSAQEMQIPAFCIDLDVANYPEVNDPFPDCYSLNRIGLKRYYESYLQAKQEHEIHPLDHERELYMAKKLKELSFSYDKILFIGGMHHIERVLENTKRRSFPLHSHAKKDAGAIFGLTEKSASEVLAEFGWVSMHYENNRYNYLEINDRQKIIYNLYKQASQIYSETTGHSFKNYHLQNIMKFARNYALQKGKLMPNLFQLLTAAKGCVDHNFAYETWKLATFYPYLRNIDNLPVLDLSVEEIWGNKKEINFHLKAASKKSETFQHRHKNRASVKFRPPSHNSICSYPKEDVVIENFARFLKKKGSNIITDEFSQTCPFSTSLEDGLDVKETIRKYHEKKLYVKRNTRPTQSTGSIVVIFDDDNICDKYSWKTTWIGEHNQESDMAFYATDLKDRVVGPGISRCEYGGFMMSYPPRRLYDVWSDPDYSNATSQAEVLLMAAIDYATKPLVVYVAKKPPRPLLKSYAARIGKKIVYLPISQLSPIMLNKIRIFHVLDGQDKRAVADEYIF